MQIEKLYPSFSELINPIKNNQSPEITGFKDILDGILQDTVELRGQDASNNNYLATGKLDDIDSIMIDMEKADIALQFTLQIRSKVLEAYQELMRMQI